LQPNLFIRSKQISHLAPKNGRHLFFQQEYRVARWFIFKPKIQLWVNFERLWNRKGRYFLVIWKISWPFDVFWPIDNLVAIWYTIPRFGILCQEKSGNLARECRYLSLGMRPKNTKIAMYSFVFSCTNTSMNNFGSVEMYEIIIMN
jgi:hypothetical protein